MSPFPREDYRTLELYDMVRPPIEVDLSDNTNLWGPHPAALQAIATADGATLTRYPSLYADPLRQEVGRRFGVSPSCVTTGSGSDDVLDSVVRAACRPPGRLVYASPTFVMAPITARMNGLEPVAVPWDDALARPGSLLEPSPDVVYLCTPDNPSGAALDPAWTEAFLERCGEGGPLVILDEAYADYHGETLVPKALAHGRAVVLRTLSKLYALAGVRIGYALAAEAVIHEVEKSRGPYKLGALAELAAVAALRDEAGWAQDVVDRTRRNRSRLARELESRGMTPRPSVTNFLLVPVAPLSTETVTGELARRGVAVRPFPDQPGLGDAIRVTVGPWAMMKSFLSALDEVLDR